MINLSKIICAILLLGLASSCSKVLQTVELEINSQDSSRQEEFNVVEKTLSVKEAQKQNKSPYKRTVLQQGKGEQARVISESIALHSDFPEGDQIFQYKIGVGDTISFTRLIENTTSDSNINGQWPKKPSNTPYRLGIGDTIALKLLKEENIPTQNVPVNGDNQNFIVNNSNEEATINSTGRIGSDGSVLLLEVGRLDANGKTLNELRSEVRNILIRNGVSPRFQLEIVEFKSQRAYLTFNKSSRVIVLDDQKTTLRDILTAANVGIKPGVLTQTKLQRNTKEYTMSLRKVFSETAPEIIISDRDHIFVEDNSSNIISTLSMVGHDKKVVLPGVGEVKAAGLSLDELRTKIASLIEKFPNSQNSFQIEIKEPLSQKAIVSIAGQEGGVISISNTAVALDEVLTQAGLSIDSNAITRITLRRQGKNYMFTLDALLKHASDRLYLQPNDRVRIETLPYKENKVFILGGISPQVFKINPANRDTVADVLFTAGGVLSSSSAKRSEVYILRGKNPVVAYHLDAQSPTQLIVANAMELRPNDILYVAEQPIIAFNRTLATIIPLRLLLRDIQDENLP